MRTTEVLKNWTTLSNVIMDLTENELERLKQAEKKGQNRLSFLSRIQGRINKLRSRRESAEVFKG